MAQIMLGFSSCWKSGVGYDSQILGFMGGDSEELLEEIELQQQEQVT